MRVVGLGQPSAGDDAVGLAVIEALRSATDAELVAISDATALVDLLDGPVLLIDALVGEAPGSIRRLSADELGRQPLWSTHGIGVAEAIGLAEAVHGRAQLTAVGIGIDPPDGPGFGLSDEVAAAVPAAVDAVLEILEEVSGA